MTDGPARRRLSALRASAARASAALASLDARELLVMSAAWGLAPWVQRALLSRRPQELLASLERLERWLGPLRERGSSARSESPCPARVEQLVRWALRAQPAVEYNCLVGACTQYLLQHASGDRVVLVVGARTAASSATHYAHAWVELAGAPRHAERAMHPAILELGGDEVRSA